MRKSFIFTMAFVYGIFSLGLNVQIQYCSGHLSGIDLFQVYEEKCDDNSTVTCCGTEHCCCTFQDIYVSIDDEHSPSFRQVAIDFFEFPFVNEAFVCIQYSGIYNTNIGFVAEEGPPDIPLFIKYKSLTYYG
jgi:hypothetical protein